MSDFIGRLERAVARVRRNRATDERSVDDPNFIGFDKYREHGAYHWKELQSNPYYRAKMALLESEVASTDRCLDLGCGDGAYVHALAARCERVVGVDADADAVRLATKQLRRAKVPNATCLNLPLSQVDDRSIGDRAFDLVYSMDVIEHLPDPDELLRVATRMAGPRAKIVIGTPLYLGDHLVSKYHVKEFTEDEFVSLTSKHLEVRNTVVLADRRADGIVYERSFIIAIGSPSP